MKQLYDELEFRRTQTALKAYCDQHNKHRAGIPLVLESEPPCLVVVEFDRRSEKSRPQLKCCLKEKSWFLYSLGRDGEWLSYANLPEVSGYQRIIDELEAAPLHVDWN